METKHKEFKAFDKVLIKYGKVWVVDFYRNYVESANIHLTLTGTSYDNDILPYEGNEHLVGTTDELDEEVKLEKGELGFVNNLVSHNPVNWTFDSFSSIEGECSILCRSYLCYSYFIRFSDFNPNDMEETKKHILCVKNGKVVRYKPE